MTVVLVAVAGALGALLRHAITSRAGAPGTAPRAWAVAGVNLVGAAIAGIAVLGGDLLGARAVAVVAVGFCGALTTFSTWVLDAVLAVEAGRDWRRVAAFDLVGQVLVGTALVTVVAGF